MIGFYAVSYSNLQAIFIPNSVTEIDTYAFAGMKNYTIYGYPNSAAYNYAGNDSRASFVDVSTETGQASWNNVWREVIETNDTAASITLNADSLSMNIGDKKILTYTMLPEGCTDAVTWESSNPWVATVENGKVVAESVGTCTITVKTGSGKEAKCQVTVSKKLPKDILKKPNIRKVKLKGGRNIYVEVKKIDSVTGYQFGLSRTKKFKKSSVYKTARTHAQTDTLNKKTVYYVRVRAYYVENGKVYYSAWSDVKKVKTKKGKGVKGYYYWKNVKKK